MAESGKAVTTYLRGPVAKKFQEAVTATGKTPYALAAILISSGLETLEMPKRRRTGFEEVERLGNNVAEAVGQFTGPLQESAARTERALGPRRRRSRIRGEQSR